MDALDFKGKFTVKSDLKKNPVNTVTHAIEEMFIRKKYLIHMQINLE